MVRRPAPGSQGGAGAQRTARAAPGPCGMPCTQPQGEGEFLQRGEQEPNGVALFIFFTGFEENRHGRQSTISAPFAAASGA
jgi:hypothetical protein